MVVHAYLRLRDELEANGLLFASDKTQFTASDMEFARHTAKILSCHGVKVECCDCITVLGVDHAAGKNIRYDRMRERLSEAKGKAVKIMSVAKGGWLDGVEYDAFPCRFLCDVLVFLQLPLQTLLSQ